MLKKNLFSYHDLSEFQSFKTLTIVVKVIKEPLLF